LNLQGLCVGSYTGWGNCCDQASQRELWLDTRCFFFYGESSQRLEWGVVEFLP
jgi:hypothetical protein